MTEEMRLKEGVMAEEIRVVEHYSASILNKVGEEPVFSELYAMRA